jgi:hypothetical protein
MRSMIFIAGIAATVYGLTSGSLVPFKPFSIHTKIYYDVPVHLPPTQIVDFTVMRLSRKAVLVSWHTEDEADNGAFEIERKNGFHGVFVPVGLITSKAGGGKDHQVLDYSFNDANSFDGTSYYRIVQKDADGRGYYTMAKMAKMGD